MAFLKSFSSGEKRVLAALLVTTLIGAAVSVARRSHPEWFLGTPDFTLEKDDGKSTPESPMEGVQRVQAAPSPSSDVPAIPADPKPVLSSANVPRPSPTGKVPVRTPDLSRPVLLNSADASSLESLPGVGPVLAERILEYRREHGGFRSVEELMEVKGIGKKTYAKIYPHVTLETASPVSDGR